MHLKTLVLSVALVMVASVAQAQLRGTPTGNVIDVTISGVSSAIDGTYAVHEYDMGRWGGQQWSGPTPFGKISITDGAFNQGIGVKLHFNQWVTIIRVITQVDPIYGNTHVHYHRVEIPSLITYGTGAINVTTDNLTSLTMPRGTNNDSNLAGGRVGRCRITRR